MKKIRSIQTLGVEKFPRFVCIDEFEQFNPLLTPYYYCGLCVYNDDGELLPSHSNLRITKSNNKEMQLETLVDPVTRSARDVFEKPDIRMYTVLGQTLKNNGLVFNKKKGIVIKKQKG